MSVPERIYVPWRRSDRMMGPPQIDEHDAIVDAVTYVDEHPEDWEATAYLREDVAAARLAAVEADRDELIAATKANRRRVDAAEAERDDVLANGQKHSKSSILKGQNYGE